MMTVIPPGVDPNFQSFLQEVHDESSRRLAELPPPSKPVTPPSGPTHAEIQAAVEADKSAQIEADWRAQIKERKRLEREQRAAAEREAQRQALLPPPRQPTPPEPEPQTPKSIARKKLRLQEQLRNEERERLRQAELEDRQRWEENEWGPLLEQNRKEIREKHRKAVEEDISRMQYEQERMTSEDAAAASFVRELAAKCDRLSKDESHKDKAANAGKKFVNEAIEAQKAKDRLAEMEHQEQIRQRQKDDLKKDQEYIEWREKVRAERCRQVRIDERDRGGPDVDRLAKIGRDYAREAEQHRKEVLEQQRKRAEEAANCLKSGKTSPRDILQEAQNKAEQQSKQRKEDQPIKREAEEFDTILARHRLARQQERKRGGTTPRWGLQTQT